jgi:hypothetical protein
LFELLEISDPPVSEIGPFCFVELGSTEQIFALYIGEKLDHQFGKPKRSIFVEHTIFLNLLRNLMLVAPNRSP